MLRTLMTMSLAVIVLTTSAFADSEPKAPAGFKSLFNGKDLTGWKVFGGKEGSWGVEKGLMFVHKGGGGWLMTEKEYGDFELMLDFKLTKAANSGVALRAPLKGNPAYQGMEIQILDDKDPVYKNIQVWQHTGSIYSVVPASKVPTKPVGQWNTYHITCKGRMVTIKLNGETVVNANLDDYKEKKAKSNPGILRDKGHIGFQEHGGRVEFRNIYIKELK